MGPRSAIEEYGSEGRGGPLFNLQVILRGLAFLRPYPRYMIGAFLFMLVESGFTLLIPYLFKVAIDDHITSGNLAGLNRIALLMAVSFTGLFLASAGVRAHALLIGSSRAGPWTGWKSLPAS